MRIDLVRVRDLLALDALDGADVIGGCAGIDAVVRDVVIAEPGTALTVPLPRAAAVVFDLYAGGGPLHREHLLDLLLRRAQHAQASALLVLGVRDVASATHRLADKGRVVTARVPADRTALSVAVDLSTAVHASEVAQNRVLLALAARLRVPSPDLSAILRAVGTTLKAAVWACTAAGVVEGEDAPRTPMREITTTRALTSYRTDGTSAAVLPVNGLGVAPALWLVAERADAGPLWVDTAERALALAHGPTVAWLAREQLAAERDVRLRGTLLTEILEHRDAVSVTVKEQAAMAGLSLSGWHIGVHLRFAGKTPPSAFALSALIRDLEAAGVPVGPFLERSDGWSTWATTQAPPPSERIRDLERVLTKALTAFAENGAPDAIAAGLGSPQRDIGGIATTLGEARQAALIAASDDEPLAVRVVQDLGASRLLLALYSSGPFREHANELVRPITDAGGATLLNTVKVYLDNACSATATSRALKIHRNTVATRIARVEQILGASLDHSHTRLALQLAIGTAKAWPADSTA
ncbi:PucR family transcriptional regulator [Actinokineospora fastidiosa]|uniref:PucR family transcriptional regulator n=1 Tax=Actinokineospora fastidiosa TaxID=1816 RepID=A0A918GDG8_9PSEU|nr:PucR family transcriptional regulator [Actinokineospora fastidiosa]GGS29611.1 hypothetical protein GCM10010171_23660 [Actinokineospora fastidiosa]